MLIAIQAYLTNFRLKLTSVGPFISMMTLNDLERRNNPYFAFFHRIRYLCRPIMSQWLKIDLSWDSLCIMLCMLQRSCWTEWTVIAQTSIPCTCSACSGLRHWMLFILLFKYITLLVNIIVSRASGIKGTGTLWKLLLLQFKENVWKLDWEAIYSVKSVKYYVEPIRHNTPEKPCPSGLTRYVLTLGECTCVVLNAVTVPAE